MTHEEASVGEYLRLVKETTDPNAYVDEELNVHFEEYDEQRDCYVPVIVSSEDAQNKIADMYGLGG